MAVIPGDTELDLKALAVPSDNRKIALAAKKAYPVYADKSIERFDAISAGVRGLQILLTPVDYLKVAKATLSPIAV